METQPIFNSINFNKLKGDLYEQHVCTELRKLGYTAILWKHIAPYLLLEANLCSDLDVVRKYDVQAMKDKTFDKNLFMDVGIDILLIKDGKFTFVQCKCGYKNGVGTHDLNGFFMQLNANPDGLGMICYTDKLGKIVENAISRGMKMKVECVKLPFEFVEPNVVLPPTPDGDFAVVPVAVKYELRDYQQKAVADFAEHYKTHDRGILSFPCACGKTITSYYISLNYKYVFIIAPCRSYVEQNLNKFKEYGGYSQTVKHFLISSDGTRDSAKIIKEAKESERVIFSSTFDSVDVVNEIIKEIGDNYIVIIDEFHNLSKESVGIYGHDEDGDEIEEEPNEMFKLITTSKKTLFVSATPRVYEIEGYDDVSFNEQMFGKVVATMSLETAIKIGSVTDYEIVIPMIGVNYDDLNKSITDEIGVGMVFNEIVAKCMFLMKGFRYYGNKKCILYARTVVEIGEFEKTFMELDKYYALGLKYYTIVSETKNRGDILQQFSDDDGYSIVFSIRTLDECIDVPKCDSIYLTYNSNAEIRNTQRAFRCNRIDVDNPNKVGRVYIYCNEHAEILNSLGSLKEFDCRFEEKINITNLRLGTRKVCEGGTIEEKQQLIKKYFVGVKGYVHKSFDERLLQLCEYFDEHKKPPSCYDELLQNRSLHSWYSRYMQKYENKTLTNIEHRKWEGFVQKYKQYFSNIELLWRTKLERLKQYVEKTGEKPSRDSKDGELKKLGKWAERQIYNYERNLHILRYDEFRKIWEGFMKIHGKLLAKSKEKWMNSLNEVMQIIERTGNKPSQSLESEKKLNKWLQHQVENYPDRLQVMSNPDVARQWEQFVEKYGYIFEDYNVVEWKKKFQECENFIAKEDLPLFIHGGAEQTKMRSWLSRQSRNYKDEHQLMKNPDIRALWRGLIKKYLHLFPKIYHHVLEEKQNNEPMTI